MHSSYIEKLKAVSDIRELAWHAQSGGGVLLDRIIFRRLSTSGKGLCDLDELDKTRPLHTCT